jgi:endo-alpha-1,4-polygalactosaminidase (GH114 family)
MSDFYTEHMKRQNKRNKLEKKLDEYNHIMELIRTIIPIMVIILQLIILWKIS